MELDPALEHRVAVHAALADSYRLRIVDELAVSDRAPSELRRQLGIESNLMAHHLSVLERAGLVERVVSAGDGRRRYLRLRPNGLAPVCEPTIRMAANEILFVCTANSARSQLAAALWNTVHDVPATSAGTVPAAKVHPEATRAGARVGLDLHGAVPRSIHEVTDLPELLITVCDRAHEELDLPAGPTVVLHWSIPDPAEDGSAAAFDAAVERLSTRVNALGPLVSPSRSRSRPKNPRP
jgi:protein-tyrosine-phosphatase